MYNIRYCTDDCFSQKIYHELFVKKSKEDLLSKNDIIYNMRTDLKNHIMSKNNIHSINCMLRSMTNLSIVENQLKSNL
jgi:hypothetical protein